jgi:hypothetical protein
MDLLIQTTKTTRILDLLNGGKSPHQTTSTPAISESVGHLVM